MLTKHSKVLSTTVKVLAMTIMVAACYVRPEVEKKIHSDSKEANAVLDSIRKPRNADNGVLDTVRAKDDIWLGDSSTRANEGSPLPSRFETGNGITMAFTSDLNLLEIIERITDLTSIPVRIDDLIIDQVQEAFERGNTIEAIPGADGAISGGSITEKVNSRFNASFSYTGKLSGLLDLLSTRFNLWWLYRDGTISFYEMDTRVFTVYALPTIAGMQSRIGGTNSDGGTGGGGSIGSAANQMETKIDTDMWQQIEKSIEGILPKNATFTISPVSGQVTVTAPPSSLKKVARYIKDLNIRLSRQVVIGVKVLNISMNENDHYGLDLNALFTQNGLSVGFSNGFTSGWNPITGGSDSGGLGVTIVNGGGKTMSKFTGSQGVIEALSTQGKTSLVTSTSVTTMNNRIAPVQVSNVRPYIDSMSTVSDSNGNPSTSVTQAQLNLGFTMMILPRILDHGRLVMSFSLTLTELIGEIQEVRFGDNMVQQPHIDSRGFTQEVAMLSGQTLVLTGFERVDSATDRSGVGDAHNTLLGGKAFTERERISMVILITPEIVVSPLSPETRVADMY